MHELSIVQALCEELIRIAERYRARKIIRVTLKIGALSNIVPELLETSFHTFKKTHPLLETSDLVIEKIPIRLECRTCGYTLETDKLSRTCPECTNIMTILEGEELVIRDVELDVPDSLA